MKSMLDRLRALWNGTNDERPASTTDVHRYVKWLDEQRETSIRETVNIRSQRTNPIERAMLGLPPHKEDGGDPHA